MQRNLCYVAKMNFPIVKATIITFDRVKFTSALIMTCVKHTIYNLRKRTVLQGQITVRSFKDSVALVGLV